SVRAFKPDPVPNEMIEQILNLTINAPSANNLQPWEFIVVAGEEKDRLSRSLIKAYEEKQISCGSGAVKPLPEVFRQRGLANLEMMKPYVKKTGVTVDTFINEGSCNFYGAPVAILICLDDCFSERQLVDIGTAVSYLTLAAHASGLSTCPIGLIASYEDEVKDLLNIPENKRLIIGIALGYPDPENPVSQCKSTRDNLTNLVRWI
ncbi:MAG: nitroreductase, partial [Dehalococcoidales bacterium]